MNRVAVKLKQDLVPMDEGNGERQERLLVMLNSYFYRQYFKTK